jgi:DNA-binding CsgD family transcriptional regulator
VLIEGAAGIGKTALLSVLGQQARTGGVTVLSARAGELEREFPYGVARQLFESHLHRASATRRRRLLRGAAGLAAPVLGLAGPPPAGQAGLFSDASFRALHGLYWLTAGLADDAPLVLLVDDAQWADPATMLYLNYLGRRLDELAVLVAVALRPAEPGSPAELLTAMRELPVAEKLHPAPLSEIAVGNVIERTMRAEPDPAFRRACHSVTGGNPFLLSELLQALAGEGVEPHAAAARRIGRLGPSSISHSVFGRLATLWPEALELARAVAVLDTDAELRHAAAIAGIDRRVAESAADGLTAAQILAPGRPLRFAHPILREALYLDLPERRRAADHARAARILDAEGADPDRAAVHLLVSEPAADEWVVSRLRAAAERARVHGAPAAALALLRRALDEPPPASERVAVMFELGRVARAAGDRGAAEYLREAMERTGDSRLRLRSARELATAMTFMGQIEAAVTMVEATVDVLGEEEREERLSLEAHLLALASLSGSLPPRAGRRIDRLLAGGVTGRTPAERALLACASLFRAVTMTGTGDGVVELAKRAAVDHLIVSERAADSLHSAGLVFALTVTDRHADADALLGAMSEKARENGSAIAFAMVAAQRARLELTRGNPAEAESIADSAFAVPGTLTEHPLATLVLALVEQGKVDEAQAALEEHGVGTGPASPTAWGRSLLLARAVVHRLRSDVVGALADARDATHGYTAGQAYPAYRGHMSSPALAFRAAGEGGEARRLAESDLQCARGFGVPSLEGIALLVLAVVVGGERQLGLLQEAVAKLEGTPRRLDHAHALIELGAALRRANHRSDAGDPLRRGMDLAQRCGASALAEQAREELLACGARPRRLVSSGVEALTASERRVARLAADGLSNPEIAQELFLSRRTIETHLRHAYQKLEIGSREDLPRALSDLPA